MELVWQEAHSASFHRRVDGFHVFDSDSDDWHLLRILTPGLGRRQVVLKVTFSFKAGSNAAFYINQHGGRDVIFVERNGDIAGPYAQNATIRRTGHSLELSVSYFLPTDFVLLGCALNRSGRYKGEDLEQFTISSLTVQEDRKGFDDLSDVDLLFLISLGRKPTEQELAGRIRVDLLRVLIYNSFEFRRRVFLTNDLKNPDNALMVQYSKGLLERAYLILIERSPTEAEEILFNDDGQLNLSRLASHLFGSAEAARMMGANWNELDNTTPRERKAQQTKINIINFDLYSQTVIDRQKRDLRRTDKLRNLQSKYLNIAVDIDLFRHHPYEIYALEDSLNKNLQIRTKINILSFSELVKASQRFDLYLTTASEAGRSYVENRDFFDRTDCFMACWLWDNHHLFEWCTTLCDHYDAVFPAHSNGQTYLHGGRSIVCSVTPCAAFQWSSDEAAHLFTSFETQTRSPRLYGKFNSYTGLTGLRDLFLKRVSEEPDFSDVKVISHDKNSFLSESGVLRFKEMAGYKAMITNPIFNDVPARLFDALLVGAIPIVPHGLPDLGCAFSVLERQELPIVTYIPDDIASLRKAVDYAISEFDRGGTSAARRRHLKARESHMLRHRVENMISELIQLAKF